MIARVAALLAALLSLGACTSGGPAAPPDTPTRTVTHPHSPSVDTAPVVAGPTRAAVAPACPLIGQPFVHQTIGMRLGRLTVLRSGGRVVGCRFYALQNSYLHASENLPPANQPAVEVTTQRYASAVAAHNAFVRLSEANRNAQSASLGARTGVCFQTDFYRPDKGQDWACAANVGTLEVVVRTVDTTSTFSTAAITTAALRRV